MTPMLSDHLIALFLIAAVPFLTVWGHRRFLAALRRGEAGARKAEYARTIVLELVAAALVLATWLMHGRTLTGLATWPGNPPGWAIGFAWAVAGFGSLALAGQAALVRSDEQLAEVRRQLDGVSDLLPRTRSELRWFHGVSVAAGVCEEVLYRGFLMTYLTALGGLSVGVIGSSLAFGLGHAYQGRAGVLKTAAIGLVMAGLFAGTGTLLAPVLLHTVVDLSSGILSHRALSRPPEAAPPAPVDA